MTEKVDIPGAMSDMLLENTKGRGGKVEVGDVSGE